MIIRRLIVKNFRGIKELVWDLPVDARTICLVGANDSTKTTVLEAIEIVLSPRWNISLSDTDFHNLDTSSPIEITVSITELPQNLLSNKKFGGCIQGWNNGTTHDEPEKDDEPLLTLRFEVGASLEPEWHVINDRMPEGMPINARERESLGLAKISQYVDRELSWGRGTPLTRLTGDTDTVTQVFNDLKRQSRKTISEANLPELTEAAERVTTDSSHFGVQAASGFRPQLDIANFSLSSSGITLHDGNIPARQLGLGTRRLISTAIQKYSVSDGAILIIDEIEYGIEPYRLKNFVRQLRSPSATASGQTFMVTHSPIVICELSSDEIYVVRSQSGVTEIKRVGSSLQAVVRAVPDLLLSRKVIICEGKTEEGILRGLNNHFASMPQGRIFEYFGAAFGVGGSGGGTQTGSTRASELSSLGYNVLLFVDSDVKLHVPKSTLEAGSVKVVLWAGKCSTEERICFDVLLETLQMILDFLIAEYTESAVVDSIASNLGIARSAELLPANIGVWIARLGKTESQVRLAIAKSSKDKGWFKRTGLGEELFGLIVDSLEEIPQTDLHIKLHEILDWIQC